MINSKNTIIKVTSDKTTYFESETKLTNLPKRFHKCQLKVLYIAGDCYESFLIFVPMLHSLTLDNNYDNITNWISNGTSPEKTKPFKPRVALIMSNLANDQVSIKLNNLI